MASPSPPPTPSAAPPHSSSSPSGSTFFDVLAQQFPLFSSCPLQCALIATVMAPVIWNVVARILNRYVTHTHINVRYLVCYVFTVWIVSFSAYRDLLFHRFLDTIAPWPALVALFNAVPGLPCFPCLLGLAGGILAFGSFLQLGITGTFLADYYGILMDEKVTGFPFNVMANPMYNGASMMFMATALESRTLGGVILAVFVFVVYRVATVYEEDYTNKIYAERERTRSAGTRKRR